MPVDPRDYLAPKPSTSDLVLVLRHTPVDIHRTVRTDRFLKCFGQSCLALQPFLELRDQDGSAITLVHRLLGGRQKLSPPHQEVAQPFHAILSFKRNGELPFEFLKPCAQMLETAVLANLRFQPFGGGDDIASPVLGVAQATVLPLLTSEVIPADDACHVVLRQFDSLSPARTVSPLLGVLEAEHLAVDTKRRRCVSNTVHVSSIRGTSQPRKDLPPRRYRRTKIRDNDRSGRNESGLN